MNWSRLSEQQIIPVSLTVAIAVGGVAVTVIAKDNDDDAAKRALLALPSISLQKAIDTAVREVGGKVIGTAVKVKDGEASYYRVELLTVDSTEKQIFIDVKDVLIDIKTGKVAKILASDQR